MDWTTFFKDFGQSLFTLGGVFLGSLITFLVNWLSLKNQSIERAKDREEQRIQAAIRAREKWTERDILAIMNSIEKIMKIIASASVVVDGKSKPTDEQLLAINKEYMPIADTIIQLVYSFDDKNLRKGFNDFSSALNDYMDKSDKLSRDDIDERFNSPEWIAVKKSAGYFQWALREKMISIYIYKE